MEMKAMKLERVMGQWHQIFTALASWQGAIEPVIRDPLGGVWRLGVVGGWFADGGRPGRA